MRLWRVGVAGMLAASLALPASLLSAGIQSPQSLRYEAGGPNPSIGWVQPVAGGVPSGWRVETSNDLATWTTALVLQNPFPDAVATVGVSVGFRSTNHFWRVCAVP